MNIGKFLFSMAKSPLGDYIVGLTFSNLSKVLPVRRVYENAKVVAFWHPKPFWDQHILIVPKKAIKNVASVQNGDFEYVQACFSAVKSIVTDLSWSEYTLLVNGGNRQEVNQLHFHLCSGNEVT